MDKDLELTIQEQLDIIFDPESHLSEAPIAMECGQACNSMLGMGNDIRYKKGAVVGALVGGPFGMIYGGAMPANSLQKLCRAKCKLDKMFKNKEDRSKLLAQAKKVKAAESKVEHWIQKFKVKEPEKAQKMQKVYSTLKGKKF